MTEALEPTLAAPDRRVGTANVWGLADHALLSAASFVTLVVLARVLDTKSFGSFVLVYASLLFANMLQSALITQPHNVLGAVALGARYRRLTTSTAVAQGLFTGVGIAAALASAGVAQLGHHEATARLLVALAPALGAWQVQELFRRILYTERRLAAAFATDLVSYGGQVLAILVLWRRHELTGPRALYIVAATSALAALVGLWLVRRSFAREFDVEPLRANWRFGRWLAGSAIGAWLSSHFYFYLAAFLIGGAASGALKASQIVLAPLNVLLLFLTTVLPSRLARASVEAGPHGAARLLKRTIATTGPCVVGYSVIVALFANVFLRALYGSRYAHSRGTVELFAVYYILIYTGQLAMSALVAKGRTKVIFASSVCSGLIGLLAGWSFIEALGVRGAVVGMIVGTVAGNAITWTAYRRARGGRDDLEALAFPEGSSGL